MKTQILSYLFWARIMVLGISALGAFAGAAWMAGAFPVEAQSPSNWLKSAYPNQTTAVQTVKSNSGTFGGYYISNVANSASSCLQVFDTAGTVTLGSTTPSMIYEIPPNLAANIEISKGVAMSYGIKFAIATTCTGNSAPSSGLNVTIYYQ